VMTKHNDDYVPQRQAVLLRHSRLQKVLGIAIDKQVVDDILYRLELEHVEQQNGWTVTPPSFRFDIEREEDLIEEVARIYGYDNIPIAHSQAPAVMAPQPEARLPLERLQGVLVDRGYQEAITYSFVDPKMQELLLAGARPIQLANPISADMAEMRTTLWSGLLNAVAHNLNRQQSIVKLFETGLRFQQTDSALTQDSVIAGAVTGTAIPVQWGQEAQEIDFFDIKADVEAILALTGNPGRFTFVAQKHPVLHPGQSAKIIRDIQLNQKHADNMSEESEEEIGWVGALHPAIATKLDLVQPVYLFELKLAAVTQRAIPHFQEIPKFPSIKRDLAIVVDENVTAQAVSDCIRRVSTTLLSNLKLFDVYRGKGIDSGRKSLAFSLTLQDHGRTLTDQDVDAAIDTILSTLNRELGATLRN
ncbi:MAG: phenylalanine--tRNA ligase subunit beta, partial [Gammaproteobacteria bacterium]